MTANRDLSKLAPIPTIAGSFVYVPGTGWQQVTKANVGLDQVDNTSDAIKLAASLAQMQSYGVGTVQPQAGFLTAANGPNAVTLGGMYAYPASSTGAPTTNSGSLLHVPRDSRPSQILFDYFAEKVFTRHFKGGSTGWTTARELAYTDSPALTGTPTTTTPAASDNSTRIQSTAGSLAQVQSFGLGSDGATLWPDLNTPIVTALLSVTGGASNNLLATPATLMHRQWGSGGNDHGTQIYHSLNSNSALNNRLLWRTKLGGVWGAPREAAALDQPAFTTSMQCAGPVRVGQYTLTTLPSAAAYNGYEIDVTNATVAPAGPKRCRSNGTNWIILNTTTIVS